MVHKDIYGLPEIPGRTLKGLWRDAVWRAEQWGHVPAGSTKKWFGSDSRNLESDPRIEVADNDDEQPDRHQSDPGMLVIDNAVMDPQIRAWLQQASSSKDHATQSEAFGAVQELYRHLYATAIDPQTGAAKDKTLRGMEVVVPLRLTAPISMRPGTPNVRALPFLR